METAGDGGGQPSLYACMQSKSSLTTTANPLMLSLYLEFFGGVSLKAALTINNQPSSIPYKGIIGGS